MPTDLGAVSARKRKAQAQAQTAPGIKHSTLVLGIGSVCPATPNQTRTKLLPCQPHQPTWHVVRLKAQWEKTKAKGRCQCHPCGEREGECQNYSYLHGNHLPSTMFGPFRGLRRPDTKQTIAIAVKYPMKSAAIVISTSITPLTVWNDAARTREKLCPMSQQKIGGEIELFPAHSWRRSRPASEHLGSLVLTSVVCCTCATTTGRSKLCYKINLLACVSGSLPDWCANRAALRADDRRL